VRDLGDAHAARLIGKQPQRAVRGGHQLKASDVQHIRTLSREAN
jgi:hypothetical protein